MGIVLPKELEEIIHRMIEVGAFDTPEAVLQEAFRLLEGREESPEERETKLAWLRAAIADGEASGDPIELDRDEFREIVSGKKPIPTSLLTPQ